jgi:OPA family glycerol-3-phosphate transporter-like MFS transporter
MSRAHLTRWQGITAATLFVGYAGYYVCRANLSVTTPLLLEESGGTITKADIGTVASVGVLVYALGKVTNGILTDYVGGRALFLLGMAASVACTVWFGMASGLFVFTVAWAVNRYVQSLGWGALVKVAARWYPVRLHATVMGLLCLSYLVGDALARLYLGQFIREGFGWRTIFFIAAATLAALAVVSWFTLKASPKDVGEEEPPANPENLFGSGGEANRPESFGRLLGPLLSSPAFWLICVMSAGLTLVRETFLFWSPTYLTEVAGLDKGAAAQSSMLFPLMGAVAALVGGVASDRLAGRHGRIVAPSLLLLVGAITLLACVDVSGTADKLGGAQDGEPVPGRPVLALVLIGGVAFFMTAPYSFLTGVMALDLGGKCGPSTAAGLIDGAGYLGGTLSGIGIGWIAQERGWPTAFGVLAGVAAVTALAAVVYWFLQEYQSSKGLTEVEKENVSS